MPPLGREHVHLPRVLPELDARQPRRRPCPRRRGRARAAEVAQFCDLREVEVVRQPRQRRDGVDGRVEDQLRPLRGPQVVEGLAPSGPTRTISSATSRASAGVVARYGPIQVAVSRTYSTSVSEWRVPLMNVTDGEQRPVAVRADDLLGAEPVLHGHQRRVREVAGEPVGDGSRSRSLAGDDHEVGLGQLGGVERGLDRRDEIGAAGHRQALLVQRAGMLAAPHQHRHLGDAREVARRAGCRSRRPRRRRRGGSCAPPARQAELAAAGQPGRAQDQDDRHQHALDDDARPASAG